MPNNRPLVTVIVPVWNREKLIRRALDSVYEQYYRPIELLVVDDGSTDGTIAAVSEWANERNTSDFVIRLIGRQHAGAPAARNAGMDEAKGKYIQFFDSDDILLPWKIAAQVEALRTSGADLAVCDFAYGDQGEPHLSVRRNDGPLKLRLALGHSVFVATPLIDRLFLESAGVRWSEWLPFYQDMEFLFEVFAKANSYVYTPGIGTVYVARHAGEQISDGRWKSQFPWAKLQANRLKLFLYEIRHLNVWEMFMVIGGMLVLTYQELLVRHKRIIPRSAAGPSSDA